MMIQPPARNDRDPVEIRDGRLREQAGEHVADHAADRVRGKDVEAVVVPEHELELRGEVAERARHDAEEDCGGWELGCMSVFEDEGVKVVW